MANNRITYNMREGGTDRKFQVVGTGSSRAAALAEANTKLAMTVGTIESASESADLPVLDYGTPHAGPVFSDGIITLSRGVNYAKRSPKLENITVALKKANTAGDIDITNGLVTAFAAAYMDGDGNTGYTPVDGHYTK